MPTRQVQLFLAAALAIALTLVTAMGPAFSAVKRLFLPSIQNGMGTPPRPRDPVLLTAGDIASCNWSGDEATAGLLDRLGGTIATLGDNVYNTGTETEYANCYDPSWGRHKARTRPAAGNHDYGSGGNAYYAYFGAAAGDPGKGYYSYDVGAWHIVVLNSNIDVAPGSPQEQWLRSDLAANPTVCTLAYMHHPRFSSGPHGNADSLRPLWQALYEAGADVVLAGHDHDYERFAPQDPAGNLDLQRGIWSFIVGTGGAPLYAFQTIAANSEVRNADTHGILELTMHPKSFDWRFVPVPGKTFADSGSANCH